MVQATPGYIAAIADCGNTDRFSQPIFQVITAETSFRKSKFKVTHDKPQQPIKVTHVRLLDGDNNVMMGRLAINITDEGKKLKPGDFIQLHLYTELTHTLNEGGGAPPKPVVYILKFSFVGYFPLLPADTIQRPIKCNTTAL